MLKTRVITSIVLLPALLWLLIYGPEWAVGLLIMSAITGSVYEMSMMIQPRLDELFRNFGGAATHGNYDASSRHPHYRKLAYFCGLIMCSIFVVSAFYNLQAGRGIVVFGLVLSLIAGVFATKGIEAEMARVLGFTVTLVYAGFPWLVMWDHYLAAPYSHQVLFVLAIVWLGDTGGYFGGRFLGKHPLSPHKSPKKTWEGAVSGLLASVLGAILWAKYIYTGIPGGLWSAMFCGLLGGISGQMGDLVESVIKRFAGVKDSGRILPGHGGLLDRIDGVLFAAPVVWFILYVARAYHP